MRTFGWLSFHATLAAILVAVCPCRSRADTRTLVLHIEARGADAELAELVDDAVRRTVDDAPSSELSSLAVTPTSLRDALRCSDLDERCLSEAAVTTSVDRILFGEVTKDGSETRANVRLRLYDAFLGSIVEAPELPAPSGDLSALASSAATLASALLASPQHGSLTVRAEPGSRVFVDGQLVELVPADGTLEVFPVRTGRHEVRIRRPDGRRCDLPVHVRARETASVSADLAAGDEATLHVNARPRSQRASRAIPVTMAVASHETVSLRGAPRDAVRGGPVAQARRRSSLFEPGRTRLGIPIDRQVYLNGSVSFSGAKVVAKFAF